MIHKRTLVLLAVLALLIVNLGTVSSALAQGGETAPAAAAQPEGIAQLLLILGVLAIIFVGASYLSFNPSRAAGGNADDEDDEDQ